MDLSNWLFIVMIISSSDDESTEDVDIYAKSKTEDNNFLKVDNCGSFKMSGMMESRGEYQTSSLHKKPFLNNFYKCGDFAQSDPTIAVTNLDKSFSDHTVINMEYGAYYNHVEY